MTVKTVIFVLLFTETSFIYPIFAHVLFRVLYPEKRMKRESGESPEQSRCCEFHARCIILVPLFFGKNGKAMYRERVRRPAKQSRKLSIRGKWAVRKWFKIIFIYSMSGRTKVLLVCAVSLGASILRLSAQEVGGDTITGKVHQIEKVTVTARRSPNKVTSAVPIQTMSRQDISQLGIQNMADAVRRLPEPM